MPLPHAAVRHGLGSVASQHPAHSVIDRHPCDLHTTSYICLCRGALGCSRRPARRPDQPVRRGVPDPMRARVSRSRSRGRRRRALARGPREQDVVLIGCQEAGAGDLDGSAAVDVVHDRDRSAVSPHQYVTTGRLPASLTVTGMWPVPGSLGGSHPAGRSSATSRSSPELDRTTRPSGSARGLHAVAPGHRRTVEGGLGSALATLRHGVGPPVHRAGLALEVVAEVQPAVRADPAGGGRVRLEPGWQPDVAALPGLRPSVEHQHRAPRRSSPVANSTSRSAVSLDDGLRSDRRSAATSPCARSAGSSSPSS